MDTVFRLARMQPPPPPLPPPPSVSLIVWLQEHRAALSIPNTFAHSLISPHFGTGCLSISSTSSFSYALSNNFRLMPMWARVIFPHMVLTDLLTSHATLKGFLWIRYSGPTVHGSGMNRLWSSESSLWCQMTNWNLQIRTQVNVCVCVGGVVTSHSRCNEITGPWRASF